MASSSLNEVRRVGAVMELRTVLERVGMLLASVGLVGVEIFFFSLLLSMVVFRRSL